MIVGFLGKGGSGKTSVATMFAQYLHAKEKHVMAIDNDHNMDFMYNLGVTEPMNYIGQALREVYDFMGINSTLETLSLSKDSYFSLSPKDEITNKYSLELKPRLSVMCAGPHTEEIMLGKQCSHVLTTPLKAYLPFLEVKDNEWVIIDEKAGADGVGTGVTTGFHAAIVVVEPTPHGIKAALQISKMLRFYNTPYAYVINKLRSATNKEEITSKLDKEPIAYIPFSEEVLDMKFDNNLLDTFDSVYDFLATIKDTRKERARERLEKLQALQNK
jgi:CO dehydrogenase maturation factor